MSTVRTLCRKKSIAFASLKKMVRPDANLVGYLVGDIAKDNAGDIALLEWACY
jgi:hypothetical protein